ncbi:hypothetical protein [Burkholderia pseudomallei]|uniref:hypothetical protein n=1 Tax=Burkholderia pseudomallei TaxID=28450 RepID=UPI00193D99C5|nr:hypothetical protein [Burkholderia pseudomallei]QRM23509.1 hypothetical protein JQX71_04290 [Burkholderia pseudomallei]
MSAIVGNSSGNGGAFSGQFVQFVGALPAGFTALAGALPTVPGTSGGQFLAVDETSNLGGTPAFASAAASLDGKSVYVCMSYSDVTTFGLYRYDVAADLYYALPAMPYSPGATGCICPSIATLADGRILVVGGNNPSSAFIIAYILTLTGPNTGQWSQAANYPAPMFGGQMITLKGGKVLYAGGNDYSGSCNLYDPVANTWTATTNKMVGVQGHALAMLPSGKVLRCSGFNGTGLDGTYQIYDPVANAWGATKACNNTPVGFAYSTAAGCGVFGPDGRTLALYSETSDAWATTTIAIPFNPAGTGSHFVTSTLLADGTVFLPKTTNRQRALRLANGIHNAVIINAVKN